MDLVRSCYHWIFIVSMLMLMSHCVLAVEDAESLYHQAISFERQKQTSEALVFYERVCKEFPNDSFAGPDKAGFRSLVCRMMLATDPAEAKIIALQIKNLQSSPERKPEQLYWTACALEQRRLSADATPFHEQIVNDYPNAPEAGPDKSGFRVLACRALMATDPAEVQAIALQIKNLQSSPGKKPVQLYTAASTLERNGLSADASSYYEQIINEYPNAPEAGSDRAVFRVKAISCRTALKDADVNAMQSLVNEIRALSPAPSAQNLDWIGRVIEERSLLLMGTEPDKASQLLNAADSLFQKVKQEYPGSSYFESASMHNDGIRILKSIINGDINTSKELTSQLKTEYANSTDLAVRLFIIAEGYYEAGRGNGREDFLRESIDLFENDVPSLSSSEKLTASAHYMLGLNRQELGEYANAAQAFQTAYQMDPNHKYADYCLYARGRCYEKLVRESSISQEDADPVIQAAYSELISKFPESQYSNIAALRLEGD